MSAPLHYTAASMDGVGVTPSVTMMKLWSGRGVALIGVFAVWVGGMIFLERRL